jgi:Plasmid pRiA4b ORF-3-like protein
MNYIAEIEPGGGAPLYQLKITLKWSKPAIWRRVVVRADMKLDRLHNVIQIVMPWTNSHMHQFIGGKAYYGRPDPEFAGMGMSETLNEKRYTLADLAPAAKKKFIYEYDFGDGWEHEIVVEKVLPRDAGFKHPICLAGANACPPDDCGGIPGYYNLLETLANPKHPDHEHLKEWIGGEWDAARFDLAATNDDLKRLKA